MALALHLHVTGLLTGPLHFRLPVTALVIDFIRKVSVCDTSVYNGLYRLYDVRVVLVIYVCTTCYPLINMIMLSLLSQMSIC